MFYDFQYFSSTCKFSMKIDFKLNNIQKLLYLKYLSSLKSFDFLGFLRLYFNIYYLSSCKIIFL